MRWVQRFDNFKKALGALLDAVELAIERDLSKLEKQGLIQSFKYTYELAWKTVKDFFKSKGEVDIFGSRDAFKLAFREGLVTRGDDLMQSIESRQLTSHAYNEETADEIYRDIMNKYYYAFKELADRLEEEKTKLN